MASSPLPSPALEVRPTRVRHGVVAFVVALGMITYLDRACIATLAPDITAAFSLSKVQMGYVFSAFAFAYALFEIPTAHFADRIGTRRVLTRIVVAWSACTMATGLAIGFRSLTAVRFLFGVGEAGAWPCMGRTYSRWMPRAERGRAQGLFFAGAHLTAGLTPLVVAALLPVASWRMIFVGFGFIGLVWSFFWFRWFRNDPKEHPAVNQAERALIAADRGHPIEFGKGLVPWRMLLRNRNVLLVSVMYFPNSFVFYFCITWLPTFLKERYGLVNGPLVLFAGLPLVLSAFSDLSGGWATDRLTRRFGRRIGHCGVGAAAYLVAALCLALVPLMHTGVLAGSLVAVATAATMFSLPAAWGTCIDLGGESAAAVGAVMNTAGQIGSLLCPLVVAYSLRQFGTWNISIGMMAVLFLVGFAAWLLIRPDRKPPGGQNPFANAGSGN